MFGTLRPRPCTLPRDERQAWRRLYCGTCKGLGTHYGTPHRALLSHDVVWLAAIVEGLQEHPSATGTCRCPIAPVVHRPILQPDSPAMQVAAAVQLLLADAWLADRAVDGGSVANLARPLLSGARDQAAARLAALGLDASGFDGLTERQSRAEAQKASSIADVACPTTDLLGRLFASLPTLPSTAPALRTASARRALGRIGASLGAVIYAIDALEDLTEDARSGAYNPCLTVSPTGTPVASESRVSEAVRFVRQATHTLQAAVGAFPWTRHQTFVSHVAKAPLVDRIERAVQSAETAVRADARAELARWHTAPWWQRWWWRFVAFAVAFLTNDREERRKRQHSWCDCSCTDCDGCADMCNCCACCFSRDPDGDGCSWDDGCGCSDPCCCGGCDGCGN